MRCRAHRGFAKWQGHRHHGNRQLGQGGGRAGGSGDESNGWLRGDSRTGGSSPFSLDLRRGPMTARLSSTLRASTVSSAEPLRPVVRPIRQAHGPEALEGQAHHPEGNRGEGSSPKSDHPRPRARRDLPRRRHILGGLDAQRPRYACLGIVICQCGLPSPALRSGGGTQPTQARCRPPRKEPPPRSSRYQTLHVGPQTLDCEL